MGIFTTIHRFDIHSHVALEIGAMLTKKGENNMEMKEKTMLQRVEELMIEDYAAFLEAIVEIEMEEGVIFMYGDTKKVVQEFMENSNLTSIFDMYYYMG